MTMSNTGNTTTTYPVPNQVPSDLIPTTRNTITLEYASKKKEWACSLNPSKFQPLKKNQNEVDFVAEWRLYMIKIQTELQEIGHSFAMKKIISVFGTYQIIIPGTSQLPTSFDDVLTIIGNKDWYNSFKIFNFSLLWMAMYGIFWCSFDMWLMDAANKWKRDKNIDYIQVYKEQKATGFVHKNMLQKSSTLIQRRIRHTMRHHHHEVLCIKKEDPKPLNCTETCIKLHGQTAVLYTSIHKEDVLSQIRNAIKSALKANVERRLIESCVQDVFNNYDYQRKIALSKSNCIHGL